MKPLPPVKRDSLGQLGDGAGISSGPNLHTVVGLGQSIDSIASGAGHTCALVLGGVKCWGDNQYGQLGNGTSTRSPVPVMAIPQGSGVISISAGTNRTCAAFGLAAADGRFVKCWGERGLVGLGDGEGPYYSHPVSLSTIFGSSFEGL